MTTDPKHDWRNAAWIAFLVTLFALAVAALSAKPASAGNTLGDFGAAIRVRGTFCNGRSCATKEGTGTMIGRTKAGMLAILTCSHVVPVTMAQPMRVEILNGDWRQANVLKIDRRADICLLVTPHDTEVNTIGVAGSAPHVDEWLMSVGYADGRLRAINVRPTGQVVEDGLWWTYRPQFIEGESGGPIISKGGVVGVITAADKCARPFENGRILSAPCGYAVAYPVVRDFCAGVLEEPVVERPPVVIPPQAQAPVAPGVPPVAAQPPAPALPNPSPAPSPPEAPQPSLGDRVDKLAGIIQTGLTVASWVGVGVGTGGIGAAVLWGLSAFRAARKVKQVASDIGGYWLPPAPQQQPPQVPPVAVPQRPPVITTENPPPPQAIIQENTFVPYERDTFAEAFAWAERQAVTKYPGSSEVVQLLRSLVNQFLASKGIRPKA